MQDTSHAKPSALPTGGGAALLDPADTAPRAEHDGIA